MAKSLTNQVRTFFKQNQIPLKGKTFIVGVSGGPDSMALLDVLYKLRYDFGFHLVVAHFNHGWRRESDQEAQMVKASAQNLHLDFYSKKGAKSKKKGSLEEQARKARFAFFFELAKKRKAQGVFLAHHQDDVAETVLMRLMRGTGLQGVRSIIPIRKINDTLFIRPLLSASKQDIMQHVKKRKLTFCHDKSNDDIRFSRNHIRAKLLPYLEKHHEKNIKHLLGNFAAVAGADYQYLDQQAQSAFVRCAKVNEPKKEVRIEVDKFDRLHLAIQRMVLRLGVTAVKGSTRQLTLAHFIELEDLPNRPVGSQVHLPQCTVTKQRKYLVLNRPK